MKLRVWLVPQLGAQGAYHIAICSSAPEVSLYFELAAEGWSDFPWRGPLDVALSATVGELWDSCCNLPEPCVLFFAGALHRKLWGP